MDHKVRVLFPCDLGRCEDGLPLRTGNRSGTANAPPSPWGPQAECALTGASSLSAGLSARRLLPSALTKAFIDIYGWIVNSKTVNINPRHRISKETHVRRPPEARQKKVRLLTTRPGERAAQQGHCTGHRQVRARRNDAELRCAVGPGKDLGCLSRISPQRAGRAARGRRVSQAGEH